MRRITYLRAPLGAVCVALVVVGCDAADSATGPEVDPVAAFAKGGNGKKAGSQDPTVGNGPASNGNFAIDEERYWHARWYGSQGPWGTYRVCYQNPLEDADGNDWVNLNNGLHHMNEKDAIILVKEFVAGPSDVVVNPDGTVFPKSVGRAIGLNDPRWQVAYIGRGRVRLNSWWAPREYDRAARVDAVGAPVTGKYAIDVQNGAWGKGTTRGDDPFNVDLRAGSTMNQWIDDLLSDTYTQTPGALRHVECDAVFNLFEGVRRNEILTDPGNIPGSLLNLIPARKAGKGKK